MSDDTLNRPLRVARLLATSARDLERGPMVFIHPDNARERLLMDGELAWVYGPRRHELATVRVDETVQFGDVVLRDIVGASPSEVVRVIKPDLDSRGRRGALA
ncbi:MAG TPA: molybdopterin dinucleotide binding domain-containing protein [Gemmatimonadaceae bacterium]|nr:molybdopterin dinucleotide binding domain-containing protein [Gemmatimonadaceae bacterium]